MKKVSEIPNKEIENNELSIPDFSSLPPEAAFEIMKHLSVKDLINLTKTRGKSFLTPMLEKLLWKYKIDVVFGLFKETEIFKLKMAEYEKNNKSYKEIFYGILEAISEKDGTYAKLFIALQEKRSEDAIKIIEQENFSISDFNNENRLSPLALAVIFDQKEISDSLLSDLPEDKQKEIFANDLKMLISLGDEQALAKLIAQFNFPDILNKEFIKISSPNMAISPLFYAAFLGKAEIFELLVKNGAVINKTSSEKTYHKNSNVFHFAALSSSENSLEAFKKIEKIYNEEYRNDTSKAQPLGLKPLDQFIMDLDVRNRTPLFYAAAKRNLKLMQYLIENKKINPFQLNKDNHHAFHQYLMTKTENKNFSVGEFANYFYSLNPSATDIDQMVGAFNKLSKGQKISPTSLEIQQAILSREQSYSPQSFATRTLKEKFPNAYHWINKFADTVNKPSGLSMVGISAIGVSLFLFTSFSVVFPPFIPIFIAVELLVVSTFLASIYVPKLFDKLSISTYDGIQNFFLDNANAIKDLFKKGVSGVKSLASRLFQHSSYQRLPTDADTSESHRGILGKLKQHADSSQTETSEVEMQKEHFSQPFSKEIKQEDTEKDKQSELSNTSKITKK